jgi:hypothetical protein
MDWSSIPDGQDYSPILFKSSRYVLGHIQPPIQWVPWLKRLGSKADHSLPYNAEIKNTWIYTSSPPIRLRVVVFIWSSTGTNVPTIRHIFELI